jgi:hypothetical protein
MSDNYGNTRTKVAHYFYSKLKKKVKPTKINDFKFDQVKSVGIIFDNDSSSVNTLIENLSKEFKSKSGVVSFFMLGYEVEDNNRPNQIGIPTVYITNKELNWYGMPKFKDAKNFIDTPFDLLINLASNETWAIKFCSLLSKAKFKVGRYDENSNVYDFMINISDDANSSKTYKLIIDYLKIINNS